MGIFDKIGNWAANIGKTVCGVADSPIAKSIASLVPGGEFVRNAVSQVGGMAGGLKGLGGDDTVKVTTAGFTSIVDQAKGAATAALSALSKDATDIRAQRESAITRQRDALQSRFGDELIYTDDLLFSAVNAIALGRVPSFSWIKTADLSVADVSDPFSTQKVVGNMTGNLIDFGSSNTAKIGDIGSISTMMQDLVKDFVLSKSLMAINPVITIVSKLRELTEGIDNPYDFFNFLGYNGPEVVRSIAGIDRPIINGMLKRISEHGTSKAFAQWFAAVDFYKTTLESFRKITADWLGEEATGYPVFLIDMVTFYIFSLWGKDLIVSLYERLATREMTGVFTKEALSAMHIYDVYDQIHYAQVAAKATYDRVNVLTSSNPTDVERVTYYIAGHDLIALSFLLQISKAIMGLSGFGLDEQDIQDIYGLCTGPDTLLIDLAAICHQDNAIYVQMSAADLTTSILDAELMGIKLTIASDDEIITTVSLEKLMSELAATIGQLGNLSVPEKAKMVNFYKNMSIEIRDAVAEDRVSDPAYTLVQLTKIDSGVQEIEESLRS